MEKSQSKKSKNHFLDFPYQSSPVTRRDTGRLDQRKRAVQKTTTALREFIEADRLFTDRGEIAAVLETTVESIRRSESRLGLDKCRTNINTRLVRYHRQSAIEALNRCGLINTGGPTK